MIVFTEVSQSFNNLSLIFTTSLTKIESLEIKHSIEVVCPIVHIFVRVQFHLMAELKWAESMDWAWLSLTKIQFNWVYFTLWGILHETHKAMFVLIAIVVLVIGSVKLFVW